MAFNDQIILKQILEQNKSKTASSLSESEFFEVFVAEQVLKNFDLNNEEIEFGITGSGNDGGIDAMYTFVNGKLLFEDTDITGYKKGVAMDLFIIQTKKSDGFEGTALDKLISTTNDILDLAKPLSSLASAYNAKLLQAVTCFRRAQAELAIKYPKMRISYIYASLGNAQQVHPNVRRKVDALQIAVVNHFSNSEFNFSFLGSRELLELARKIPSTSFRINLLDAIATGKQAYLCLINLRDYYGFIIDDDEDKLRKSIFDANVRDYQGKVEVNQGIRDTLMSDASEDFWWLNNGITIIASNASIAGKTITLEDPQIVNGLQTSTEIHDYFKTNPKTSDVRSILARIIVTSDSASQDRIIRATNSQTAIPLASLKATDKIQRDIEDFFRNHELYYDRRKNFYKNQGHPRDHIISIPYLAQAIMAIVLREPNEARARPSSILKKDNVYKQIFNPSYPMTLYLICAKLMRLVDEYIKSDRANILSEEKNNLRFHFAMYVALTVIGQIDYRPNEITRINLDRIDDIFLSYCLVQVVSVFRQYRLGHDNANPDTIGKSKEFISDLLKHFKNFSISEEGVLHERYITRKYR